MFTGIVEGVGRVVSLASGAGGGARLVVDAPFLSQLTPGESVAVDGCCLTALDDAAGRLTADLSPETLARTTLGGKRSGDRVNLERAARLGDRLGGHLVSGHVDLVERVIAVAPEGDGSRQRYSVSAGWEAFIVPKGSIGVDGVSLTVAALGPGWLEVALVPHTLAHTTLAERRPGDSINVEHDVVGKHVLRALALGGRVTLSPEVLARLGVE